MKFQQADPPVVAATKAGFSVATAYRIGQDPRLPSQKKAPRAGRRRDPLAAVWDSEVVPVLKSTPGLRPIAIFDEIRRRQTEHIPVRSPRGALGNDQHERLPQTGDHRAFDGQRRALVDGRISNAGRT